TSARGRSLTGGAYPAERVQTWAECRQTAKSCGSPAGTIPRYTPSTRATADCSRVFRLAASPTGYAFIRSRAVTRWGIPEFSADAGASEAREAPRQASPGDSAYRNLPQFRLVQPSRGLHAGAAPRSSPPRVRASIPRPRSYSDQRGYP